MTCVITVNAGGRACWHAGSQTAAGLGAVVALAGERGWDEDDAGSVMARIGMAMVQRLDVACADSCVAALAEADREARRAGVILTGAVVVHDRDRSHGVALGRVEVIDRTVARRPDAALTLPDGMRVLTAAIGVGNFLPAIIAFTSDTGSCAVHVLAEASDTAVRVSLAPSL